MFDCIFFYFFYYFPQHSTARRSSSAQSVAVVLTHLFVRLRFMRSRFLLLNLCDLELLAKNMPGERFCACRHPTNSGSLATPPSDVPCVGTPAGIGHTGGVDCIPLCR